MSKTIIRKRSKQKEIDPKFGVSEWDPAELDIRQTRHGTYESRPPPRGGTWRDQIKEEAYKLRQRQREADSPEFISPHSTTDTMDTDEAGSKVIANLFLSLMWFNQPRKLALSV